MESEGQKKREREQELEKRLRTPKAVLSIAKSTEEDTVETNLLIKEFLAGKFFIFETQRDSSTSFHDSTELEEIYQREQALTDLKDIIKNWVVSIAKQNGMEESLAVEEEAKLFTFGSHRLGVNSRGGDIDTVILCPSYVDRETHFFEQLYGILEKRQEEGHVEELVKVNDPGVLVPVITMSFHKIPVDLAFVKVDVPKIDKKLRSLNDNNLLAAVMDKKMVISMNGPRNVDMIIQAVDVKEDSSRIANFRTTLKLLKLWAKNRGIYSNAMGYVTGISLAILVAKICQLFPNLKPNKLIQKFFQYYSIWNWTDFPVIIDEIKTFENMEEFNNMQWYDPKSEIGEEKMNLLKTDFASPMMVITPAFPVMNATKKVTKTHLSVMKEQFAIGKEIVSSKNIDWQKLFQKLDFFHEYYNFIEVSVLANDEKEFHKWLGLVQSQLIMFTNLLEGYLEYQDHPRKVQVHPYPNDFERQDPNFKFCSSYYYGIKFQLPPAEGAPTEGNFLDLYDITCKFLDKLDKRRKDSQFFTVNLRIVHLTRNELPPACFGIQEPKIVRTEPNTNLGKRHLDKPSEQGSEFEPEVGKRIHVREDLDPRPYTNGVSSPKEFKYPPPPSHGFPGDPRQPISVPVSVASTSSNSMVLEQKTVVTKQETVGGSGNKITQIQQVTTQVMKPKPEIANKPVAAALSRPTVFISNTTFKPISATAISKEKDDFDDFL